MEGIIFIIARGGGELWRLLFYLVPQEILVMAPEMQEEEGISGKWYIFNLVPQDILVTAPEMQEEFLFSGSKTIYASDRCHNILVTAPEM